MGKGGTGQSHAPEPPLLMLGYPAGSRTASQITVGGYSKKRLLTTANSHAKCVETVATGVLDLSPAIHPWLTPSGAPR